jgi:hypothetical protein
MKIKKQSTHITPAGGNVFADLGFTPEEATQLQAESKRIIVEKLACKNQMILANPQTECNIKIVG